VTRTRKKLRSDIACPTPTHLRVRGRNLVDLIGTTSLGDFAFLELTHGCRHHKNRRSSTPSSVVLVEHGLTPSAHRARLTHLGSPEALQASVAAGLLGNRRPLSAALPRRWRGCCRRLLKRRGHGREDPCTRDRPAANGTRAADPGLGPPDPPAARPATPRLFEVAAANGFSGRYVELIQAVSAEATNVLKRPLPSRHRGDRRHRLELGFPWRVCRGLAVIARSIGLVAHCSRGPGTAGGRDLERVDDEATEQHAWRISGPWLHDA